MIRAATEFRASLPIASNPAAHARETFDSLDKAKVRAALHEEQHALCIYCERGIDEGGHPPPIEHWHPLGEEPQLALDWENLYLSCATSGTCDDAKAGRKLACDAATPSLPPPSQITYEHCVGFTKHGEMYVRDDAPLLPGQRRSLAFAIGGCEEDGTYRPSILNLNAPALVEARREAIDAERVKLDRRFAGRRATQADRCALAERLLSSSVRPRFVSVRVAYLKKTLGQGR